MIRERTLRMESEFKLSQASGDALSLGARREICHETQSLATSAFTNLESATELEIIQKFAQLGRSEHWLVDDRDMQLNPSRILGKGSFGTVVEGSFYGSSVAVKVVAQMLDGANEERRLLDIANELRVLRRLRHPSIVAFHGAVVDLHTREVALVLELVNGQSLLQFVEAERRPDDQSYGALVDICRALRYLHGHRPSIVHGDLKPHNVLVEAGASGAVRAKLLDFGLARVLGKQARPLGGTLIYMAPEVFRGSPPTVFADIYPFGLLLYFVATGAQPFKGMSLSSVVLVLKSGQPLQLRWSASATSFEIACQEVCHQCIAVEPASRPSALDVHMQLSSWPWRAELPLLAGACSSAALLPWAPGLRRLRGSSELQTGNSAATDVEVPICASSSSAREPAQRGGQVEL